MDLTTQTRTRMKFFVLFAFIALAGTVSAESRFYIAENSNIQPSDTPNEYVFCVTVAEVPMGAYIPSAQFVFEKSTSAQFDWDLDDGYDLVQPQLSPYHTVLLDEASKWDSKRFEATGTFCGAVLSPEKLTKVIFSVMTKDGTGLRQVPVAGASCEDLLHKVKVIAADANNRDRDQADPKTNPRGAHVRPQVIFITVLSMTFMLFVFIVMLRCCCMACARRRRACDSDNCHVERVDADESSTTTHEMQVYNQAQMTVAPTPAMMMSNGAYGQAYILVPTGTQNGQGVMTVAPQFVQMMPYSYPTQQQYT